MTDLVYGIIPPERVRKGWEPCSMATESARQFMQRHLVPAGYGAPLRCVLWERPSGDITIVVAEYPNGRRAEVRRQGRDFATTLKWWSPPTHYPSPLAGEGDSPKASGVRGFSVPTTQAAAA